MKNFNLYEIFTYEDTILNILDRIIALNFECIGMSMFGEDNANRSFIDRKISDLTKVYDARKNIYIENTMGLTGALGPRGE